MQSLKVRFTASVFSSFAVEANDWCCHFAIAASQASPLSMKGSSMMLLMMMEDMEPTHLPSSLSEDVETVADDVYLPSLNISSVRVATGLCSSLKPL